MKYTITIEKITPVENEKYSSRETIYEQTVEKLPIAELIRLINPEDSGKNAV